jgi:hypothetical protein
MNGRDMKKTLASYRLIIACCAAGLIAACTEDHSPYYGPCVVIYREAILHIDSALDEQTGEPISSMIVRGVRVDSFPEFLSLLATSSDAYGVTLQDSVLSCELPCGFGTHPGDYELDVTAPGYGEQTVHIDGVTYSISEGPG